MHAIQHREKTNTYSCYQNRREEEEEAKEKKNNTTSYRVPGQECGELLFNFERPTSLPLLLLTLLFSSSRTGSSRSEGETRGEFTSKGSGSGIGIHFKVDTSRVGPFSLLVKGWGRGKRGQVSPKYRLRVPVCDYDGRLHPDHATSRAPSSSSPFFDPS